MPEAAGIERMDVKYGRSERSPSSQRKCTGQGGTTRHNAVGPWGEDRRDDPLLALLEGKPPAEPRAPAPAILPDPEFLTKPQAAALMQISIRTLDRLVVRGDVPHMRLSKRCVRFPAKALKSWLEARIQFRN